MRWGAALVLLGASTLALAKESALHAELRREGERASDACQASFKAVPGCAYTLFTDHPLHIAAGSMPPQNGFGLGGAFVWSKNTRNWRMSWDFDGVGASAIKPVFEWAAIRWLNLALLGEINGRFVDIRGKHGQSVPSIEALYTDATAPGLSSQPGFAQLREGLRIKPAIGNLQLNYMGKFQQFFAPSSSHNSFLRWTVDLDHTYSLYGRSQSGAASRETLGPDSCAPAGENCPGISRTRNFNGSIDVRLLLSESLTSGTSVVPFYFQQTLGGQDINSALSLGSYQDYRFRAPNVLLLQESFEHSIWGPFGLKLMADQGRVALMRGDIGFSHLKHSFAGGLTLRAGGFPMISLMFAWGGPEGHHNIANMNTSLLGGSARPLLD